MKNLELVYKSQIKRYSMNKIITHNGTPHFDDFFSCCLVIAKYSNIDSIERKEPTEEELSDDSIWKLDVGKQLLPEKRAFDHHQKVTDDCTISLLLKHWGLWEKTLEVFPSFESAAIFDAKGVNAVIEYYGIKPHIVSVFRSFLNDFFLYKFGQYETILKDSEMFTIMWEIGRFFFTTLREYDEVKKDIEKNAEFRRVSRVPIVKYLGNLRDKTLMYKVLGKIKFEKWGRGGISISKTDRPPNSIAVHRYDDDHRVDFRRLPKNTKGIEFIHPSGFFMVVNPSCEYELYEMIKVAIK